MLLGVERVFIPTDVQTALKWLKQGPLLSARPALVREVVGGLTRSLLIEHFPSAERERQLAALQAVLQMYPLKAREHFRPVCPRHFRVFLMPIGRI